MDIILGIIFAIGSLFFFIFHPIADIQKEKSIIYSEQSVAWKEEGGNIIFNIPPNIEIRAVKIIYEEIPEPHFISEYKERLFDKNTQLPSLPDDHTQEVKETKGWNTSSRIYDMRRGFNQCHQQVLQRIEESE